MEVVTFLPSGDHVVQSLVAFQEWSNASEERAGDVLVLGFEGGRMLCVYFPQSGCPDRENCGVKGGHPALCQTGCPQLRPGASG